MPTRVSRRALFLAVLGAGWIGYGLGIANDPRYGTARGLHNITRYVPLESLGWLWVACGSVAVAAAVVVRCPRWQAAGFAALAATAMLWGVSFLLTWAGGGYPSASGSACAWLAFAVAICTASGMIDPPRKAP